MSQRKRKRKRNRSCGKTQFAPLVDINSARGLFYFDFYFYKTSKNPKFIIFNLIWKMAKNFKEKVLKMVSKIPKGKTITYKEAARRAGSNRAWRAVGNILNKNYDPKIPCHRVIRSDGKPGGYNRGSKNKIRLLKKENPLFYE